MDIEKILLLYLCMAIAVSSFFPSVIFTQGDNNILSIFHIQYNETSGVIDVGTQTGFADSNLDQYSTNEPDNPGFWQGVINSIGGFFQSFVDGLKNVLGALKILGKFLFSPFLFIADPNLMGSAPFFVKMIFALPLVLMGLFGIMKFIRGLQ